MEKLLESFHIALSNLAANTARSVLSILGIVIGIASVVTILSVSAGARRDIIERVNTLGVDLYTIRTKYDKITRRSGKFELKDVENIQRLPYVRTAFPQLNISRKARSRRAEERGTLRGVTHTYLKARNRELTMGRNFSPIETEERSYTMLLSQDMAVKLFPQENPLGQSVYIEGTPWEVIGVYGRKKSTNPRARRRHSRPEMLVPLTTLIRTEEKVNIAGIEVHVKPGTKAQVSKELVSVMERNDPKRRGLFRVWDQQEYLDQRIEIDKMLSFMVTLVGSISLLVGGIGMMNVMLTSVAERTREIGLRRAVGARKMDILTQFLVESSFLSSIGGLLGLILGIAIARFVPVFFHEIIQATPQVKPIYLLVSVGSAALMGVVFGLYPAIKASNLPAAEALRTE